MLCDKCNPMVPAAPLKHTRWHTPTHTHTPSCTHICSESDHLHCSTGQWGESQTSPNPQEIQTRIIKQKLYLTLKAVKLWRYLAFTLQNWFGFSAKMLLVESRNNDIKSIGTEATPASQGFFMSGIKIIVVFADNLLSCMLYLYLWAMYRHWFDFGC